MWFVFALAALAQPSHDFVLTPDRARMMDSDALAAAILGDGHRSISGHRISFRPDGRISYIQLAEEGHQLEAGTCLRQTHTASFDGSGQPDGHARLHRMRTAARVKFGQNCASDEGWIGVRALADLPNAKRLLADLAAIQRRPTDAPQAAIYCRDDTKQGMCGDNMHQRFKGVGLDDAWQFRPPGNREGSFYTLTLADRTVDDAGPTPQWVLRFMPQEKPAQPVLLMRYYRPLAGPPLPPDHVPDLVVGDM